MLFITEGVIAFCLVKPWSEELCAQVKLDRQNQEEKLNVVNAESNEKTNRNDEETTSLSNTNDEKNAQNINVLKHFRDEGDGNRGKGYDIRGDETCAICMEDYKDYEDVAIGATCVHMYHKDCLIDWLQTSHDTCPACRSYSFPVTKFVKIAKEQLGDDRFKELVEKDNPELVAMYMTGFEGSSMIQNETNRITSQDEVTDYA